MKAWIVFVIAVVTCVSAFGQDESEKDDVLVDPIETWPEFPGGIDSLKRFIAVNLIRSKKTLHYEGKVFVEFVVDKDGSTSDFKVVKGLCEECDKRALEVLQKMPKWTPAKSTLSGKAIRFRLILPVKFEY